MVVKEKLDAQSLLSQYAEGHRDFAGVELFVASLAGAVLKGIDLSGANLMGANLIGANLEGARLVGTKLFGAKLTAAQLSYASLEGANLEKANLQQAVFNNATYDALTRFSPNFSPADAGMQLVTPQPKGAVLQPLISESVLPSIPACDADVTSTEDVATQSPILPVAPGAGVSSEPVTAAMSTRASSSPAKRQWMYRGRLVSE